ncbi:MAG: acetate--CoA ligase [Planctomycetota bacterium]
MSQPTSDAVQSSLDESRKFPPPDAFAAEANVRSMAEYEAIYQRSIDDPEAFWASIASRLHWFEPWDKTLEWDAPDAKWFVGGKINACYNAVDRQVADGLGDKPAIIWEGEPTGADGEPEVRVLTYADLQRATARFANALKAHGVKKGDVVTIYMPMVPELAIAKLACARIGAPHSVIFGGFSASAIRDRVEDGKSRIVITADGGWRRGNVVPLKQNVDDACAMTGRIETVIVYQRCHNEVTMQPGRDVWWHDTVAEVSDDCPCEPMDSEDLLFILYTSGSTGKPKGIMHTTGGYLVHTYLTAQTTFDLKGDGNALVPERDTDRTGSTNDVYWCTADIGWITGHSYIIYGVLPNRVPTLMYEGAPNYPEWNRFWDMVERHKVTIFYTAPTAIRAFMKQGEEPIEKHDLSSLRLLGTVGEPINPEAWMWYHQIVGGDRCPIVDTWWQTETGGHMLTPVPGATTTTPGSCTRPFFGVDAACVDEQGVDVENNTGGILVIKKPWPSMLRGIYGDRDRFVETYWSKVVTPDGTPHYTAGDGARIDPEGNFWIMGRIDDVIVVAGHNLGTMEVESALVSHPRVAEAAVVGFPHDVKGNGIAAFCILRAGGMEAEGFEDELKQELREHVAKELGPIAKPDKVILADALPKTRSGKIMRRLLRDIAAGREVTQDTTTLEDRSIVDKLAKQA